MNDKKEPFNAVGDPFFKQVGEEHVEEEGDGGRGDSALGAANNGPGRRVPTWDLGLGTPKGLPCEGQALAGNGG